MAGSARSPHPIDEVERGDQPSAALLHGGDVVGVDVGAVLDGVDARLGGKEDALRAMRVRGHLAAQAVRIGHHGLQFLEAVLAGLRIVALGQHAAGGAHLDQIGAVLDVLAHVLLHGGDAVGDAFGGGMVFGRQEVVVAVAAGDAERRSAHLHVRTRNVARVDVVAQSYIGVPDAPTLRTLVNPASSVILAKRTPLSASRTASVERRV
jgi:hypothetical protein